MQNLIRLFQQFQPREYKLDLDIDRIGRKFSGSVTISGTKAVGRQIILHSKDLDIKSILIAGESAKFVYGDNDSLIIETSSDERGATEITINYSGVITDPMHGIYPCYYEHEGVKKELIATQFESHHAREVFPCIDEPEAKATFDVKLTTESGVQILGNMPIKFQTEADGKSVTAFETTPTMSTYLLAWVIGELHSKSAKTESGIEVNVWATPSQPAESLDFALDIAVRSTDFFEQYFEVGYPLTKCDHVALPDFGSGAMENWGLITYREATLLANPTTTSISAKRYIASVIAHELSHQWFGNLVTMRWWDDLWLNESFATMIEYVAIDALEPNWNVWLDFASNEAIAALRRDSLAGVQPVKTEVNHPDEIGTLFDGAIVYAKGARLIKMMRSYIGEDAFRSGLTDYFKKFAYKNTVGDDLWDCLSKSSGKDVGIFMRRWIEQSGFPVLHATYDGDVLHLSQNKLSTMGDTGLLWPIPLNSNYTKLPLLLDDKSSATRLSIDKPIRFNVGFDSHYITDYDDGLIDKLIDLMANGLLAPIDRLQLINEQAILARSGVISTAKLIPLVSNIKDENVEAVWDAISIVIADVRRIIELDDEAEDKLRQLVNSLTDSKYTELGWDVESGEDEATTKLRSVILSLAAYAERDDAIKHIFELYDTVPLDSLDPEIRGIVLSGVAKHRAADDVIVKLVDVYKNSASSDIKNDICSGLTSVRQPEHIDYLLNLIQDTSAIKTQDTFRWIAYLMRNRYSRTQTWQWIRQNWRWIEETFGSDKSYDDYPRYAASSLSTKQQLDEYVEFFEPLMSNPALTRVIQMGINEITDRVRLIERDHDSVKKALSEI